MKCRICRINFLDADEHFCKTCNEYFCSFCSNKHLSICWFIWLIKKILWPFKQIFTLVSNNKIFSFGNTDQNNSTDKITRDFQTRVASQPVEKHYKKNKKRYALNYDNGILLGADVKKIQSSSDLIGFQSDLCCFCDTSLNIFSKGACLLCGKKFCSKHLPRDNHNCKRNKTSNIGYASITYQDKSSVYDTSRRGYT